MNQFADDPISLPTGAASATIVLRSLLMLSGLGLGAFLLAYSSVHAKDPHGRTTTTDLGSNPSYMSPLKGPPEDIPPASPTQSPTPAPIAPLILTAVSVVDAGAPSPLPEPKRAPSLLFRRPVVAPPKPITVVRIEPNAVPAPDTNPYDEPEILPMGNRSRASARDAEATVGTLNSRD